MDDTSYVVQEVLNKLDSKRKRTQKKSMDFSKKFIVFGCLIYTVTLVIAAASWFMKETIPNELLNYSTILLSASGVGYLGKSGLENKAKFERAYDPFFEKSDTGEM